MESPSLLRWSAHRAPPPPPPVRATHQSTITAYLRRGAQPAPSVPSNRRRVVSLFDADGTALAAWADRGYECVAYMHSDRPREWREHHTRGIRMVTTRLTPAQIEQIGVNLAAEGVAFACASPPSRDLSVAGARHWKRKRNKDPEFQDRTVELIRCIDTVFHSWNCPFYISNPASSQLRKLWRPPSHTYQPHQFGKYLEPTDSHPLYPECIPNQDAYTQHQGLWTGGGFRMPEPKPVPPTWRYFTPKSKPHIRRRMSPILLWGACRARGTTPRGFARALCQRLLGESG